MGYRGRMNGHGFRGIASTVLHELGYRYDIIELQLAHQDRDEVSAAYNHATDLRERRKMMQAWADYLDRLRSVDSGQSRKNCDGCLDEQVGSVFPSNAEGRVRWPQPSVHVVGNGFLIGGQVGAVATVADRATLQR
jgi:hypothetical protein